MLLRRAKPLLGTIVEVSLESTDEALLLQTSHQVFLTIQTIHALMSRHEEGSELSAFNRLPVDQWMLLSQQMWDVLSFAHELSRESLGWFDVFSSSHDPQEGGWSDLELDMSVQRVRKHRRLIADLGGIAKGYAVDCGVASALQGNNSGQMKGWINAGGDARLFGAISLDLAIRHPTLAARLFRAGKLANLAVATSVLNKQTSQTVWAPTCMMADALTKIVARAGSLQHPLLQKLLNKYHATATIL